MACISPTTEWPAFSPHMEAQRLCKWRATWMPKSRAFLRKSRKQVGWGTWRVAPPRLRQLGPAGRQDQSKIRVSGSPFALEGRRPRHVPLKTGRVGSQELQQLVRFFGSGLGDRPPLLSDNGHAGNLGIFGRSAYFPSLSVFVVVNSRDQDAWILRLTSKNLAP